MFPSNVPCPRRPDREQVKLHSYVSMILLSLWILKFIRGILKSMKLLKILHVIMGIHFKLSCIENKKNLSQRLYVECWSKDKTLENGRKQSLADTDNVGHHDRSGRWLLTNICVRSTLVKSELVIKSCTKVERRGKGTILLTVHYWEILETLQRLNYCSWHTAWYVFRHNIWSVNYVTVSDPLIKELLHI